MTPVVIGPGSWVRCVSALPASEMREGSVYKVLEVHAMGHRCNGPPDHICHNVALVLAGVAYPACSTCFVPVRPQGTALLDHLLTGAPQPPYRGRR